MSKRSTEQVQTIEDAAAQLRELYWSMSTSQRKSLMSGKVSTPKTAKKAAPPPTDNPQQNLID
jgi:hypothetical protein